MSPRNSMLSFSPISLVCFEKLMSQLLMPGPQQMERGALPIVPNCGPPLAGSFENRLGSKTKPDTRDQGGAPGAKGPVKAAQTVPRGLTALNGATRFGSPGASKRNVESSSSRSDCEVMRPGKPLWKITMPDISQPLSSAPLKPSILGTSRSHT